MTHLYLFKEFFKSQIIVCLYCFHFIKFNKSIWGKKKKFHSSSNFDPVTSLKLHTANSTSGWEGTKCPYFYIDFPTLKKGRKKLSGK